MIKFSKEKVLLLHQLITQETGGSVGVRDEGLLESAWKLPFPALVDRSFTPPKRKRAHESAIA
jgi:death-on-curing protein